MQFVSDSFWSSQLCRLQEEDGARLLALAGSMKQVDSDSEDTSAASTTQCKNHCGGSRDWFTQWSLLHHLLFITVIVLSQHWILDFDAIFGVVLIFKIIFQFFFYLLSVLSNVVLLVEQLNELKVPCSLNRYTVTIKQFKQARTLL